MNFSNRIGTPYYILTSIINPNKRKYKMGVDNVSITRYTPYNNAKRWGGLGRTMDLLTVEQVAQELQVNVKTVYQWIKSKHSKPRISARNEKQIGVYDEKI